MPSKTSKPRNSSRPPRSSTRLWKAATGCSEAELGKLARELAHELKPGDRVLMEGPMGVGKTTFSRSLLEGLGVVQPPEGSPTFAIAHEYRAPKADVVHVDFYRLRSEAEIEEAGIEAYFWERNAIVIAEWTSMWPGFEASLLREGGPRNWRVELSFASSPEDAARRDVRISRL